MPLETNRWMATPIARATMLSQAPRRCGGRCRPFLARVVAPDAALPVVCPGCDAWWYRLYVKRRIVGSTMFRASKPSVKTADSMTG